MTEAATGKAVPGDDSVPRIHPVTRKIAEYLLSAVFDGYLHTRVSGREHVPPPGRATIIAANHVSSLDVFAAGFAVVRPGFFLAKEEATRIPLFGPFLKSLGAIPAQRDGRDMTAVKRMVAVLRQGNLVGVAPEGTRSPDGRLGDFDSGFVWLAARSGAQIVPCAIHGTWDLMPKGARFPRRGTIWVRFAPPLSAVKDGARPSRDEMSALAEDVRGAILGMLADLVAETGRANPAVDAAARATGAPADTAATGTPADTGAPADTAE